MDKANRDGDIEMIMKLSADARRTRIPRSSVYCKQTHYQALVID
jgi:hypothetical protein